MKNIVVILTSLAYSCFAFTQNLVPNPSFEDYISCPDKISLEEQLNIKEWRQPTKGSVDYFNTCSEECGMPENFFGNQPAKTGNAYTGIHVLYYDDYREYLQAELIETLKAGCKYRVMFYVCLSEHSMFAISQIGAKFTRDPISSISRTSIWVDSIFNSKDSTVFYREREYNPHIVNSPKNILKSTDDWMFVAGEYTAKGGERYITIGNYFNDFFSYKEKVKDGLSGVSYYYIDNVMVSLKDCNPPDIKNYKTFDEVQVFKPGQSIVLNNVLFEFDKIVMLEGSYKELDKLVKVMKDNPKLEIEIGGHTDNKGSVAYNLKLSRERAKAVTLYLVSKGVRISRIAFKGYGRSIPIAPNDTDEGRQLNRRVEFKILKN